MKPVWNTENMPCYLSFLGFRRGWVCKLELSADSLLLPVSYKASQGIIANLPGEFRLSGSVSYRDILAACCHAAGSCCERVEVRSHADSVLWHCASVLRNLEVNVYIDNIVVRRSS